MIHRAFLTSLPIHLLFNQHNTVHATPKGTWATYNVLPLSYLHGFMVHAQTDRSSNDAHAIHHPCCLGKSVRLGYPTVWNTLFCGSVQQHHNFNRTTNMFLGRSLDTSWSSTRQIPRVPNTRTWKLERLLNCRPCLFINSCDETLSWID